MVIWDLLSSTWTKLTIEQSDEPDPDEPIPLLSWKKAKEIGKYNNFTTFGWLIQKFPSISQNRPLTVKSEPTIPNRYAEYVTVFDFTYFETIVSDY